MKKTYMQPSTMMVEVTMTTLICNSQDITSNNDITYGGIDEEGEKDPEARRYWDCWEEEEVEEEDGF